MTKTRIEHDFLGSLEIPADAYWGIHTQRAMNNFRISSIKVNAGLIRSLAQTKKACCLANVETGYLPKEKAEAIENACDEIAAGKLCDQFPIDALQGGAGTSTNMNINEVIANRAIELLSGQKGNYDLVHPLEDVNLHQSTNDVYPTAVKVAAIFRLHDLSKAIANLQGAFQEKEKEFAAIVKLGRTELQEAIPITLGAEFSAFAEVFSRDRWRTFKCEERLRVVNLGGTAVGTGLAAPRDYIFMVIEKLRDVTGLGLSRGENIMAETANADAFVEVSGIFKAHAVNLIKIFNDLRLMNFLGEIRLPQLQAGSSIMPGKVNPVIAESLLMVCAQVIGHDSAIAWCAAAGNFELNVMMPLMAWDLLDSIGLLAAGTRNFETRLVRGLEANRERAAAFVEQSLAMATALAPIIGYEQAAALAKEASASGRTIREVARERSGIQPAELERLLDPRSQT